MANFIFSMKFVILSKIIFLIAIKVDIFFLKIISSQVGQVVKINILLLLQCILGVKNHQSGIEDPFNNIGKL